MSKALLMIIIVARPVSVWAQESAQEIPDPDLPSVFDALETRLLGIEHSLEREPARASLHWERLRTLYALSVADESRVPLAEAEAQTLLEITPNLLGTARASAYLGALEVVKAKHAFLPTSKVSHVRRGLKVLDSSVLAHPTDVEIRNLRLLSTFYLPFFFRRGGTTKEDLTALANLLPRYPYAMPPETTLGVVDFVLENATLEPEVASSLAATRSMIRTLTPPGSNRTR